MSARPIYQFYAELDGYEPAIWRRFQVTDNVTVARLAYVLMTLFEMTASHLFCFEQMNNDFLVAMPSSLSEIGLAVRSKRRKRITDMDIIRYEIPDEGCFDFDSMTEIRDATDFTLKQALPFPGCRLSFWYDFGDDWRVSVDLENIVHDEALPGKELPRVLEGGGFGIVEDCGGIDGLMKLAKAYKKKKGAAYEEFREWLGVDELDMESFDMNDMNFRLKKIPRIYMQIYEQGVSPTQRSENLIERAYLKR